jgi:hypothetical protein
LRMGSVWAAVRAEWRMRKEAAAGPVAVISVGPRGVAVEPVIDATKIMLAMFTALGSMLVMLMRMRSGSRG